MLYLYPMVSFLLFLLFLIIRHHSQLQLHMQNLLRKSQGVQSNRAIIVQYDEGNYRRSIITMKWRTDTNHATSTRRCHSLFQCVHRRAYLLDLFYSLRLAPTSWSGFCGIKTRELAIVAKEKRVSEHVVAWNIQLSSYRLHLQDEKEEDLSKGN